MKKCHVHQSLDYQLVSVLTVLRMILLVFAVAKNVETTRQGI